MRYEPYSLAHYGITGQKWGIRRFQNEDGSLTPAGKERYYHADKTLTREGKDEITERINEATQKSEKALNTYKKPKKSDWNDIDLYYDELSEYNDLKAQHEVNKAMKKFMSQHNDVKISELENEYDRLFSEKFNVYEPYVKERRKERQHDIFDDYSVPSNKKRPIDLMYEAAERLGEKADISDKLATEFNSKYEKMLKADKGRKQLKQEVEEAGKQYEEAKKKVSLYDLFHPIEKATKDKALYERYMNLFNSQRYTDSSIALDLIKTYPKEVQDKLMAYYYIVIA